MMQTTTKKTAAHHAQAMRRSIALTQTYYRMYRPGRTMITPEEIIAILKGAKVKFVVMGLHGIGGWRSEPRATDDVDFLVQKRDHRKAVEAIKEAYPHLEVLDQSVVMRFVDPERKAVVIDLIKPYEPFLQAVFKNSVPAGRSHQIPDLEMALACKFAAMISDNRPAKKRHVDAGDFSDIVQENSDLIDMPKLRRLASKIGPKNADRIEQFVADARAGRILKL